MSSVLERPTGEMIACRRNACGLSQTAAANLIGSTRRTLQDWEAEISHMHPGLWELFKRETDKLIKER